MEWVQTANFRGVADRVTEEAKRSRTVRNKNQNELLLLAVRATNGFACNNIFDADLTSGLKQRNYRSCEGCNKSGGSQLERRALFGPSCDKDELTSFGASAKTVITA